MFVQCVFYHLFYFLYYSICCCPSGLLCFLPGLPTSLFLLWYLHDVLECSCGCVHTFRSSILLCLIGLSSCLLSFAVLLLLLLLPHFGLIGNQKLIYCFHPFQLSDCPVFWLLLEPDVNPPHVTHLKCQFES